ncbi:MAG: hypothetical protein K6G07_03325, partial [Lachnospiraceae bacterium]|nr:hypothetical protein [Lachnospiraceae bacterium]
CGEHLTDYYVRELRRYNVAHDSAKNGPDCDKTRILLLTVRSMIDAKNHPTSESDTDSMGMDHL